VSDARYRTAAWLRKRAAQLAREPLCSLCAAIGKVTSATVADHVTPHRGDATSFWEGALQSLCATCHSAHKQAQERGSGLRGCDTTGVPLDPAHPWNGPGAVQRSGRRAH